MRPVGESQCCFGPQSSSSAKGFVDGQHGSRMNMPKWRAGNFAAVAGDVGQKDGTIVGGDAQLAVVAAENPARLYFRSPSRNVGLSRLIAVIGIDKYKVQRAIGETVGGGDAGRSISASIWSGCRPTPRCAEMCRKHRIARRSRDAAEHCSSPARYQCKRPQRPETVQVLSGIPVCCRSRASFRLPPFDSLPAPHGGSARQARSDPRARTRAIRR